MCKPLTYVIAFFLPLLGHSQGNGLCPDTLWYIQTGPYEFQWSVPGLDPGQTVHWDFGDGFTQDAEEAVTHVFSQGDHTVSATLMDLDCAVDGPFVLSRTFYADLCGVVLSVEENLKGLFTVTAWGYPEEYPMHWDMGDGTSIVETWVVDNIYNPGTYDVCCWYTSEFCPDTVEACVELVYTPDTICSAEFSSVLMESEWNEDYYQTTELHAWVNSPEMTYEWDFGDGPAAGSADTLLYNYSWDGSAETHGTQVCLTTFLGTCSDTVCHRVMNCEYGDLTIETSTYGIDLGDTVGISLHVDFFSLMSISDDFQVSNPDSIHETRFCLPTPNCGYMWIDASTQIDSVGIRVFALNSPVVVLDTIYPGIQGYYMTVGTPDCLPISVNETEPGFRLFPTLTNDQVHVFGPDIMTYTMFDLSGKLCAEGRLFSGGQISMADFTPGLYLLLLRSGDQSYTTKIIRLP